MTTKPATILVIEDNPITRKLVRATLDSEGYRVVEAADGAAARDALARKLPDLVLLDLVLPDVSGFLLLQEIRALPGGDEIPVLAFTGLLPRDDEARAAAAGFTEFLVKPVEPSRLVETIRAYVRAPPAARRRGQEKRVLLVDDDPVQLKLARAHLEYAGFAVETAADGEEALAAARSRRPDAILADVLMPRLDGFRLCHAIRQDPVLTDVPVVLQSNQYIDVEDRALALRLGASAYLARTPDLRQATEALLDAMRTPRPRVEAGAIVEPYSQYLDRVVRQLERQAVRNAELSQQNAMQAAALTVLGTTASALARRHSVEDILHDTLYRCIDAAGLSVGVFYLEEGGQRFRAHTVVGYRQVAQSPVDTCFGHPELLRHTLASNEPVLMPTAEPDAGTRDFLDHLGLNAALLVPVRFGPEPLGVLLLASNARSGSPEPWVEFARVVSGQLGQAIALGRAFDRVQESEERYRLLFETNPLPSWVFDRETLQILAVNDAAVEHYGYPRDEFLRLTIRDLRPPDDIPLIEQRVRDAPSGPHSAGTWRHHKRDGTEILVEVSAHALTYAGRPAELVVVHDVTEQRRASEAIREREERFQQVAENIREVFFVVDAQFRETVYISPAYEAVWGRDPRELYDNPRAFIDPVHPEDRDRLFANIAQVQAGKDSDEVEFRVLHANGEVRWVLSRSVPVRNAKGDVYRIAGVALDITERKQADEALSQRTRLAELNAEVGVALTEGETLRDTLQRCADALVRHLDAAFARIWSLNEETNVLELEASAGLYTHIDGPHSRVPVGTFKIGKIAAERRPHLTNTVIGDPLVHDQEWAKREGMVSFVGYPLIVQGRVVGVMAMFGRTPFSEFVQHALGSVADGIAVGIERKRGEQALRLNEERFRALVENSGDAVALLERDGNISYLSQSSVSVLGYEPRELIGTNAYALLHRSDVAAVLEAIHSLRDSPGAVVRVASRFRHKEGEWHYGEGTLTNRLHDRVVRALVFNFRDVTRERQLEEQFRQAQKMEAVGRLAGGVAHDFNNLLTVITSYSALMLEDLEPTDPRREDLNEILRAATGAAGLTRQLLAFSRQQVLEPRILDLNDVVGAAGKMLQRLIGEDVELVTVLAPDLGWVKADPGQIEQVIMNLAVNARDAMPDGGKLTIETSNTELDESYVRQHPPVSPGAYVQLSVSDTGIGMDEATRARLFEPFFTTKEKGRGTGLGLATVYGIVKQSAGSIWVYSEPGHGTVFKIYLPRVHEGPVAAQPAVPPEVRGSETVVVAEDAEGVRAVVQTVLRRNGYTVLPAPDGQTALDLVATHPEPIHLLITDVIMPGMSGRQLADRLREIRPGLKVLFVSGYTDDAIIRHGMLEPGIAFLQKPFTPESLSRKVREVLDQG
jgi:two-component system cell cycle sensor histidine kinase/response regulator CckA